MVFKKLVLSICNIFNLRGRGRIKRPSLFEVVKFKSTTSDKINEEELQHSPGGSRLDEAEICCVCLSRLKEGEETDTRLLPCLHEFHSECINRWLNASPKTCPICRFLVEEEEKTERKDDLTEDLILWFSSFHVAGF